MRVSVTIDSSDAKATSSGDTTRRDGFGTPHAGANTNVSNGPTDARSTNRRIMALALPTFGQLIAEPTFILIDTAIVGHIGDAALAGLSIGSTIILTDYAYSWPTRPLRRWHICWERVVVARDCRQALMACGWP